MDGGGGVERLLQRTWSAMATLMMLNTLLPPPLRRAIESLLDLSSAFFLGHRRRRYLLIQIHEDIPGTFHSVNSLYRDVELYLSKHLQRQMLDHSTSDTLRLHRPSHTSDLSFTLPPDHSIPDSFSGTSDILWTHRVLPSSAATPAADAAFWDHFRHPDSGGGGSSGGRDSRIFTLQIPQSLRSRLLLPYLQHISDTARSLERAATQRKLFTNDGGGHWESVDFRHPSTFDTLALPPSTKAMIVADLSAFVAGERFYHDVGRVWKRGYLLYGPPGTGKSSLIAAIANYLRYDIYDLELTSVATNSELKSLLIRTKRKSVIVIEDVDCSVDLSDRRGRGGGATRIGGSGAGFLAGLEGPTDAGMSRITLSGMLNFTDGLWSTCGEERIFIFTTNHKERLDPALLRPGRMDLHIELSHCTFDAFKILAANYLKLRNHDLFPMVEKAMEGCRITPAEVVEMLLTNSEDVRAALQGIVRAAADSKKVEGKEEEEEGAGEKAAMAMKDEERKKKKKKMMKKVAAIAMGRMMKGALVKVVAVGTTTASSRRSNRHR